MIYDYFWLPGTVAGVYLLFSFSRLIWTGLITQCLEKMFFGNIQKDDEIFVGNYSELRWKDII